MKRNGRIERLNRMLNSSGVGILPVAGRLLLSEVLLLSMVGQFLLSSWPKLVTGLPKRRFWLSVC
jgi:hypothetical protein